MARLVNALFVNIQARNLCHIERLIQGEESCTNTLTANQLQISRPLPHLDLY